jgi:DNA polymerase III epsilon subunit-like protein
MAPVSGVLVERTKQPISLDDSKSVTSSVAQQTNVVDNDTFQDVVQLKQVLFFDLETGGLASACDILQIAAIDCEGDSFNVYCRPTESISRTASRVNELTYKGNVMYYRKKPVPAEEIRDALIQFAEYIESRPVDRVLLIAHNAAFDKRFLTYHIALHGLESMFYPKLMGYADSVKFIKRYVPGRASYKLGSLTHEYLPKSAAAELHNAVTDVINLQLLFRSLVLRPMVGESRSTDPEAKLSDLEYQRVDLKGNTIVPPKVRKQKAAKGSKAGTKKAENVAAVEPEEVAAVSENGARRPKKRTKEIVEQVILSDDESVEQLPRRALSRACKKAMSQLIDLEDDSNDSKRRKTSKKQRENAYTSIKSKTK